MTGRLQRVWPWAAVLLLMLGIPRRTIDLAPLDLKPGIPTVWLVGDSTVHFSRGGGRNPIGWGDELARYLDLNRVNLVNRAIVSRSSRSYITEGHWDKVLATVKPGDIVLIQFGHNDSGAPGEPTGARISLPGIDDETRDSENPIWKPHEKVHTFGWYLRKYVADTRAKGATPILCSLIPRNIWKDGKIVRNTDTYAGWTREVADATKTDFIDLNEITARKYDALGPAAVEQLFGYDDTHTTAAGAIMNAESVVAGLKALPKDPLAGDFSAKGETIAAYRAN